MSKQHSIADARSNLPRLIREAESGKAVQLTRRGVPVAFLIGRRQYERLVSNQDSFGESYRDFRSRFDTEELDLDPDRLFAGVRDETEGREIDL